MSTKTVLAHYSPEDVVVLVGGFLAVEGYLEGTFINITKDVPFFTTKESSDGVVSRVANKSGLYTVNLTLMSTSESNLIMTRLALLDNLTYVAKFPLIIKDTLGSTLLFSTSSWVENVPTTDFDTGVTSRSWNIKCAKATLNVGGNESASGLVEDAISTIGGLVPSFGSLF